MMNFAFAGILEQFEDDYDSEETDESLSDDEINIGGLSGIKRKLNRHDESNSKVGLSTQPSSGLGPSMSFN